MNLRGRGRYGLIAGLLATIALIVGVAQGQSISGRPAAVRAALAALGVQRHSGAEIVFALRLPVPAGTVITEAGPRRPESAAGVSQGHPSVVLVAARRAWLFYEDLAPFQQYEHAGRVVLVDTSGRTQVSRTLLWPPAVGGRLPAFLSSLSAYDSAANRVFYRPYAGGSALRADLATLTRGALARSFTTALDPTSARDAATMLAAQHACTIRLTDTLTGGYYAYAHISQSRAGLTSRFDQLSQYAPKFASSIYQRDTGGESATAYISATIARFGCRDALVYLAGGGYRSHTAVNVGMELAGGQVSHQDISLGELRSLIHAHPGVGFNVVIDAPYASGFQSLRELPNVQLIATPTAPADGAFTYLPEARVGGSVVPNKTNPLQLLQFTDRLTYGLFEAANSPCELAEASVLQQSGGSVLAYLLARGFVLGAPVDFVAQARVGSAPQVYTRGFSSGGPDCGGRGGPVTAVADGYAATSGTRLSVNAASGVLANDTDRAPFALSVDQLNGAGGTPPFTGQSAKGATVTMNADGSFTYDPTASAQLGGLLRGQTTTDTFTYRATNGHHSTATATVTITVTGSDHPPVANADTAAASNNAVLHQSTSVLANDTDPDGDTLSVDQLNGTGGTAPFSGLSAKGAQVTMNADGTYTYDPTVSPSLQAIPRGQTTTDTFTYRASDGFGGTSTATVTITVTGAFNHPPVANPDTASANNTAVLNQSTSVLANDTDLDGDTLTVDQLNGGTPVLTAFSAKGAHVVMNAANGPGGTAPFSGFSAKGAHVLMNTDGTYSYDARTSETLLALPRGTSTTDTFTYRANDGHGGTSTATVTITVTGTLNHPPVANADTANANNTTILNQSTSVLANDTDLDGDTLSVDQLNGTGGTAPFTGASAKGAQVTMNADGTYSYDPTASQTLQALPRGTSTTDTFTYRANDGHGGTSTTTVTITVTGTLNHPPVANPDVAAADNNAVLNQSTSVLANDTDADGDALSVDQLNGTGGTAPFSDLSTDGAQVTMNANGTYSYDPTVSPTLQALPRGQTTTDTFTYRANDGHGGTATAIVTITVTGVINHPPVANPDSYSANNTATLDVAANTGVLANDTDLDGDTLSVDQLNGTGGTAPFAGTSADGAAVSMNADGSFSYDPTGSATLQAIPRGQTTTDTFTYRANDGNGGTATATVTVVVTGTLNHPPVANPDTANASNGSVLNQSTSVLANDTDADGDTLAVDQLNGTGGTAPFTGQSAKGAAVTMNANGTYSYDPTGSATLQALGFGATTTDTFTYRANDGNGGTATATVTITVTGGVDHSPTANPDTANANNNAALTQSTSVLANDTSPDGLTLTVDQINPPTGATGTAPYTGLSAKGAQVSINADGTYTYDPTVSPTLQAIPRGQSTTDTFSYQASDGHGGTSNATVTVTVNGVINHPPVANPDSYTANNNAVLTVTPASSGVLANDTDLDGDTLTVDKLQSATGTAPFTATSVDGATVTMNADGTFAYDATNAAQLHPPNLPIGQSTTDSFTYEANDGNGGTSTATVNVTVTAVDTPPTANNFTVATHAVGNTLLEVGSVASPTTGPKVTANDNVLNHASDPDLGDSITITGYDTTSLHGGSVSLSEAGASAGSFTYLPAAGYTGPDSFTYTVTDTYGKSSTGTVALTVANRVWYVNNADTGSNDGRSASPFHTLAQAQTASGPGDTIYVFKGDGTTTGQDSGIALQSNQTLLSQLYQLSVGGQTLYSGTPNSRPSIGNSAGTGVTLASGATVQGFDIAGTGAGNAAVAGGSGTAGGTVSDNTLTGTSSAGGLKLNGTSGTWTVKDASISASGAGAGIALTSAGTVNFSGSITDTATNAPAFTSSGTALSGTIASATSTGSPGAGIAVDGATGSIAINGGSIGSPTTAGLESNGGTADITYAGNIGNTTGHSVSISNRTGGTVTASGTINDTGSGLSMTSNTGSTIKLTGTITASTGANPAFTATGGGTISASGTGSTLTTTTATALNVANTTIGASGLTFQAISAGTASSGPARGISVVNPGSTGGLTVTGVGTTAGSGGMIQNTTSTGSATLGSGDGGVYLNDVTGVSLTDMRVTANHSSGIYGTSVSGLTLSGDSITNNGTNQGKGNPTNNDSGVRVDGLSGTTTISSTTVSGSAYDNVLLNSATGGTTTLNATNSTFGPGTTSMPGGYGLGLIGAGATLNVTATGDTFTGNYSDGLAVADNGNGPLTAKVTGDTMTNNLGTGVNLASGGGSLAPAGSFTIANNTTITGQQGNAINVGNMGGGTWTGHITSNNVGSAGTANSGSIAGAGINVFQEGSGTLTADISGNTVNQVKSSYGIQGIAGSGNAKLNLNIVNNSVTQQQTSSQDAITVLSGELSSDTDTVCVNATGNTATAVATGAATPAGNGNGYDSVGLSVVQSWGTFEIQGYTGSGTDYTAIQNQLNSTNTLSGPSNPTDESLAQATTTFTPFAGTCATAPAGPARDLAGARTIIPAQTSAQHHTSRKHRAAAKSSKRSAKHHGSRKHRASAKPRMTAHAKPTATERAAAVGRVRAAMRNVTRWLPAWLRR